MAIETNFNIGDSVLILPDGISGFVVSIWIIATGLQYEVVYWNAGKREKEYFFERELRAGR